MQRTIVQSWQTKHSFFVYNTLYYIHPTRVDPVNRGLCYNTRLCTSNSMIFKGCIYIHMENILYKYGWNRSLDNKFMNLYLEVCPRKRRTSKYFQ